MVETDATVGSCCVRVGSGVETDATTPNNVRPPMHRGKDTFHKTLETMCNMSVPGPNNFERAVQTDLTLLRHASVITGQTKY